MIKETKSEPTSPPAPTIPEPIQRFVHSVHTPIQIHILIIAFDSSYLKNVSLYAGGTSYQDYLAKGINATQRAGR